MDGAQGQGSRCQVDSTWPRRPVIWFPPKVPLPHARRAQGFGAATVGLAGREADILRRVLWPCAIYLLLGGALVALLATTLAAWVA